MLSKTNKRTSSLSDSAARIALVAAPLFIVLLVLLHFLEPEFDPSWRMISEYELGRFGWLMQVAFLTLATAATCTFVAIKPYIKSVGGYIGLGLLLLGAFGIVLGASFITDPITIKESSTNGQFHTLGGSLMILGSPFMVWFVSLGLLRNPTWQPIRKLLLGLAALVVLSLVLFFTMLFAAQKDTLGPDVLIGWPNRLLIFTYALWLTVVARHALKLGQVK